MKFKKTVVVSFILLFLANILIRNITQNKSINNLNLLDTESMETISKKSAITNFNEYPNINAKYGVIFDRNSKRIIYGKNENTKCKMASTTKIMTAIIVLENCNNLNEIVTISKKSARNWWITTWFIHK